ncbi:Imm41 family immunity protein [uncultured Tenacibaculum sp.]|uniref:Imm41 family immunity protein n=1 Tax=uncultured Tenacibaculum sp. TaxID=174713 RepID=UPI002605F80A|nr:Imm41 family immunity protein [uncultured Tenacibaculum sp.]
MKLIDELNAENGSFLLELRTDFNWNHNSFINLLSELNNECKQTKGDENLSRDIASGIWYISDFIKSWTKHKNFPKKYSDEYYKKAYELINDLAYSYFTSESPYQSENKIDNHITKLKNVLQQRI